jgi:hypothetical protein
MSNGTTIATTTVNALSSALSALSPGQLSKLGKHLTQSDEMKALQVIDAMIANPAAAASMSAQLTLIPNLPLTVTSWVNDAIANPATFQANMSQAKAALLSTATSPNILGGLFG